MRVRIIVTEKNDRVLWNFYNNTGPGTDIIKRRVGVILEKTLGQYPKYTSDQLDDEICENLIIKLASGEILSWSTDDD